MRAATVYRALLWCYPAQFRHEYGYEMEGAFVAQLRDARRQHGGFAVAAIWSRELLDLLPTAMSEHLHVIRHDLRQALRVLAATPAFTAVAVLSLALGIGANTAIFSLLNSVLMHALPVRAPHELVMLTNPNARGMGVGAQGGETAAVVKNGCDSRGRGVIVNSSRGIIYASGGTDFAAAAKKAAQQLRDELNAARRA